MIKTGDHYCDPEFIEFENNQIIHFDLDKKAENKLSKKVNKWNEKLSESKYKFVNDNRIRIFRMGKTHTVISETKTITKNTEFATDYERIKPTKTELTTKKINKLEFKAEWNGEKFPIIFNKNLDSKTIKEINKRLNNEGQKLLLENLQGTYFVSVYNNGERISLIGIKEVDEKKSDSFWIS